MAWTIRWRIVASFGIVLAAMVIMGAVTYTGLARIRAETATATNDSLPGLAHAMSTGNALLATFVTVEQFALQQDPAGRQRLLSQLEAKRADLDNEIATYETTIFTSADRDLFERFKQARRDYGRVKDEILAAAPSQQSRDVVAAVATRLVPEFERAKTAIDAVFTYNRTHGRCVVPGHHVIRQHAPCSASSRRSRSAVVFACLCGFTLLRAITRPLGTLTRVVDVMRKGDFTQRALVHRRDELGALAEGFNRMTEELTALVGQVQKSGLQVTTSVTEIAATAREQQATATEIAATTTEIGATSKEISATSKELVKTMSAVSEVAEQSAALAGAGQAGLTQMEQTIRHVMDAAGSVDREARHAQRTGRRHQPGGHDDHEGGGSDQPALAERGDRGGKGRRIRPRIRRRRHGSAAARRSDGRGDLRHRSDGQRHPVGGLRRRDEHGQVLGGSAPRPAVGAGRRRSAVAGDPAGAGAGAALRGGERRACRRRRPAPSRSPRR